MNAPVRPSHTRRPWLAGAWFLLPALVLAAPLLLLAGCNPGEHYELLSFFFDGVPDPNAPVDDLSDSPAAQARRRLAIKYNYHQPYAQENCVACHTSHDPSALMPGASVCAQCHGNKPDQFELMHGPVAVGDCLVCHNPHQSTTVFMLRDQPRALCGQCHTQPDTLGPTPSAHMDPQRSCLDCHSGHGGDQPNFLHPAPLNADQPDASTPQSPGQGEVVPG
jgi:predicted CXXCH cytochrome family protein